MNEQVEFWCAGCRRVLKTEGSWKIFQTGFYKGTHALGVCKSCEKHAEIDHSWKE